MAASVEGSLGGESDSRELPLELYLVPGAEGRPEAEAPEQRARRKVLAERRRRQGGEADVSGAFEDSGREEAAHAEVLKAVCNLDRHICSLWPVRPPDDARHSGKRAVALIDGRDRI